MKIECNEIEYEDIRLGDRICGYVNTWRETKCFFIGICVGKHTGAFGREFIRIGVTEEALEARAINKDKIRELWILDI